MTACTARRSIPGTSTCRAADSRFVIPTARSFDHTPSQFGQLRRPQWFGAKPTSAQLSQNSAGFQTPQFGPSLPFPGNVIEESANTSKW
jgi:hypothetical protein